MDPTTRVAAASTVMVGVSLTNLLPIALTIAALIVFYFILKMAIKKIQHSGGEFLQKIEEKARELKEQEETK